MSIIVFFLAGAAVLAKVNHKEGIKAAVHVELLGEAMPGKT